MSILSWEDTVDILGVESIHPGGFELTKNFCELLNIQSNHNVLEIGTGSGKTAIWTAQKYKCNLTGIEYSEHLANISKEKVSASNLTEKIQILNADAHNIPFPDNTFDIVYAESVIYSLDMPTVISEIYRVLKPGGTFGTHDMIWSNKPPKSMRKQYFKISNFPLCLLDVWELTIKNAGFTITHTSQMKNIFDELVAKIEGKKGLINAVSIYSKTYKKYGLKKVIELLSHDNFVKGVLKDYVDYFILTAKK